MYLIIALWLINFQSNSFPLWIGSMLMGGLDQWAPQPSLDLSIMALNLLLRMTAGGKTDSAPFVAFKIPPRPSSSPYKFTAQASHAQLNIS